MYCGRFRKKRCLLNSGYLILELIMGVGIVSLIYGMSVPLATQFYGASGHWVSTWHAAHMGYYARQYAISTGNDTELTVEGNNFLMQETLPEGGKRLISKMTFPPTLKSEINGSGKLGYKPSGAAKYAGTLSLKQKDALHYMTIQVGLGQINVR